VTVPVVRFTVHGAPRSPADARAGAEAYTGGVWHVGEGRPYTLVYDGTCKVCGKLVGVLVRWDRGSRLLEIVPSQFPGVQPRFPWIPARAYLESLQLVGPGGRTWQGAAAIERLLDILPRGQWISWIFSIPFVRALADRFYRWFARNRYKLGCGSHCALHAEMLDFGDEPTEGSARPA
jgi:predicted DCC family thiol-disulfide oxidoreductase YuxK